MFLRLAYFQLIYVLIPIFILAILYRFKFYKSHVYKYPAIRIFLGSNFIRSNSFKKILFFLRAVTLVGLLFLIMRPQWVDERSKVNVEGVDITLAIDVSGSMRLIDDLSDRKPRIEVAKTEAIRFIEKRPNDPIGVVMFGAEVISRCPLTLDKMVLKEIIGNIQLGDIDYQGTWLGTGIATAINRLRNSKSKTKIIILLTDGSPTPERIAPDVAVDMAKQFNIKIYTIGIGNEDGCFENNPFFGLQRFPECALNVKLLQDIAQKTGGKFFRAANSKEMRLAYDTIDNLEKTKIESELFHNYYEAFLTFIWIVLALLGIEFLLRFLIWRGL
ncbi:MAG: VWA domain-containing protein [bacterium]